MNYNISGTGTGFSLFIGFLLPIIVPVVLHPLLPPPLEVGDSPEQAAGCLILGL
jgi:hypothetical protein